jgi:hypothetical protein
LQEHDLVLDAIDFGIVARTFESLGVLLYVEDLLPAFGEGESYGVTPCAAECVDEDRFLGRCYLC